MDFRVEPHGIDIDFHGPEVEVVSKSVHNNNEYLRLIGNENSVQDYDEYVAGWEGYSETYTAQTVGQLNDLMKALERSSDEVAVEEQASRLIEIKPDDTRSDEQRLAEVASCYEFGSEAGRLLKQIKLGIAKKISPETAE